MTLDSGTLIRSDLESKVLPELQKIAESLGVEGHQRLRKGALIQAIMDKASGDGQGAKAEPDGNGRVATRTERAPKPERAQDAPAQALGRQVPLFERVHHVT